MQVLIGFKTEQKPIEGSFPRFVQVREGGFWYSGFELAKGHGVWSYPHNRTHWFLKKLVHIASQEPGLTKDDVGVHIINPE